MQSCVYKVIYFPGRVRSKESHMAQWLNSCLWRRSNRELPPSGQITTLSTLPCVLQQSSGSVMEREGSTLCALTWAAPPPSFPGCPGLPPEPLRAYHRGHLQQMPFQPHPTASAQRGSLLLSLENINVIPFTQPPLASLAGCSVYLRSAWWFEAVIFSLLYDPC